MHRHHRPAQPGAGFFESVDGGTDPARLREAGDLAATALVRGVQGTGDDALAERLVRLADTEGLETLAEVWSGAPADSLAGSLWRLYLVRAWVYAEPARVAREYEAGRGRLPVDRVLAGVADPPGPDELTAMVDDVLRGIVGGDYAVTLLRAAAFARIVATGRAGLESVTHAETVRMLTLADQLQAAGRAELEGHLA